MNDDGTTITRHALGVNQATAAMLKESVTRKPLKREDPGYQEFIGGVTAHMD